MAIATQTIENAQAADVQSNVLYVFAHDKTILDRVDFFPTSTNQRKEKGCREKTLWNFLEDRALAVIPAE
jgi:hypothetical protein